MIKIFDTPEYMTVEQAEEKFRPNAVVMIKCEVKDYWPVAGYVAAAETLGGEDFKELNHYERKLLENPANGEVHFLMTELPYEGQGLFISQDF
ncbi:MAG: hypothetical protein FWF79_10560 [Defluviitaleaceae bacterium]|nr:hypothetical protein [Defluviitaleaceae bacterium]